MKILKSLLFTACFLLFFSKVQSQGLESFDNFKQAEFTEKMDYQGNDALSWNIKQGRFHPSFSINGGSVQLKNTKDAAVILNGVKGGMGILSFDLRQSYNTAISVDIFVNGVKKEHIITPEGTVMKSIVPVTGIQINEKDLKELMIQNTGGFCSIDNIKWTAFK
jgi:hypothetical protein